MDATADSATIVVSGLFYFSSAVVETDLVELAAATTVVSGSFYFSSAVADVVIVGTMDAAVAANKQKTFERGCQSGSFFFCPLTHFTPYYPVINHTVSSYIFTTLVANGARQALRSAYGSERFKTHDSL